MKSVNVSRAALTEQLIKEYERKNAPQHTTRNYAKEDANRFLTEAYMASTNREKQLRNKSKFLQESKNWLMEECIYKLFNESLQSVLTEEENALIGDNVKHAMVYNFIQENGGVSNLMRNFYEKNVFLSEIAKCVDHYYEVIVNEASKKGGCCDDGDVYKIPSDVQDDFYKDLNTADFGDVTIQISSRVVDAIDQFVTDNNENLNNIKDILSTTKEKVAVSKKSVGEAAMSSAKRAIANIKNNRINNVFGIMMEQTAKSIMKDDTLVKVFTESGSLDVGKIKAYCAASYTFLETVNTAKMVTVDSNYISKMLEEI